MFFPYFVYRCKQIVYALLLSMFSCLLVTSALAKELPIPPVLALTEEFPPYTYTEDGKILGFAHDFVEQLFRKSGLQYSFAIYPWKRALTTAKMQANTMIFATVQTPERMPFFEWIGPIAPTYSAIYQLKEAKHPITALGDLKYHRTGVTRGYASADFLRSKGFREGEHFELANTNEQCMRKFIAGRVDLFVSNEFVLAYYAKKLGVEHLQFRKVLTLRSNTGGYLAVNKSTDPRIIARLKKTFSDMQKAGEVEAIQAQYLH